MIRPQPLKPIPTLSSARQQPDLQHLEDLSRLADEITEMAAHLAAGTCELLELIHISMKKKVGVFPALHRVRTG